MISPSNLLCAAGLISFGIAALHIFITTAGPKAYDYFGAGEDIVMMVRKGSVIPTLLTIFIAGIFAVFGLYAFSAAGLFHDLPLRGPLVVIIGILYTLRGAAIFFQLERSGSNSEIEPREILFSLISFTAGVCYLTGSYWNWKFIISGIN